VGGHDRPDEGKRRPIGRVCTAHPVDRAARSAGHDLQSGVFSGWNLCAEQGEHPDRKIDSSKQMDQQLTISCRDHEFAQNVEQDQDG